MTNLATGLSDADAVALRAVAAEVEQARAEVNAAQARETRALARAEQLAALIASSTTSSREADMARRTVASEIAVPLRESDRTVQREMGDALTLVEDYPATLAAWEAGRISERHVDVVVRAGAHLPTRERRVFDEKAAGICGHHSTGRARDALGILAERLNPRSATERHRDARESRRVWVGPLDEGMSRVTADVPTILGEGIADRLHRMATLIVDGRAQAKARIRDARGTGVAEFELDPQDCAAAEDGRTVEQIRADVFCDLLLAGQPGYDPTADADGHGELGAIRAHVHVVVNATTLAGVDEQPADLVGAAPIDAATARQLAGNCSGWDRVFTDPVTGQVTFTDRYTATSSMRRHLTARDRHCRFPGCRVPALRCDLDHTDDHAHGGPTCLTNLACLCPRHHTMKQFTPWLVRQLGDGILEWTSPTGRVYLDEPPAASVWFLVEPPPPF